jgi:hypothetical protein
MHTILFNVNERWSSGKVNDKITFLSDWTGPFVKELLVDWCIFFVQVHLQIKRIIQGNIILKLMSKSGNSQDVVNQFHQVTLFICAERWLDSDQTHVVVKGYISVIE